MVEEGKGVGGTLVPVVKEPAMPLVYTEYRPFACVKKLSYIATNSVL